MNRNAAYFLATIILITSCGPSKTVVPTELPLKIVASPTTALATPTAFSLSEPTATVTISSCQDLQQESLKIMPLGDSITFGAGNVHLGGYRNLLGTLLASDGYLIDFVGSQKDAEDVVIPDPDNEGHPGWRIRNITDAIDSEGWLESYQPDIILLHIGSNDLRYGNEIYAPDHLSALLDDILTRLPNTRVIVAQIIPTRWGSDSGHRLYTNAIPEIAASKGPQVSIVDMRNILSKSDFITLYHPSPDGYDKMAHAWESAILALDIKAGCNISR